MNDFPIDIYLSKGGLNCELNGMFAFEVKWTIFTKILDFPECIALRPASPAAGSPPLS